MHARRLTFAIVIQKASSLIFKSELINSQIGGSPERYTRITTNLESEHPDFKKKSELLTKNRDIALKFTTNISLYLLFLSSFIFFYSPCTLYLFFLLILSYWHIVHPFFPISHLFNFFPIIFSSILLLPISKSMYHIFPPNTRTKERKK